MIIFGSISGSSHFIATSIQRSIVACKLGIVGLQMERVEAVNDLLHQLAHFIFIDGPA